MAVSCMMPSVRPHLSNQRRTRKDGRVPSRMGRQHQTLLHCLLSSICTIMIATPASQRHSSWTSIDIILPHSTTIRQRNLTKHTPLNQPPTMSRLSPETSFEQLASIRRSPRSTIMSAKAMDNLASAPSAIPVTSFMPAFLDHNGLPMLLHLASRKPST